MIVEDLFELIGLTVVLTVLLGAIVDELRLRRRLSKYWSRPCTGRQWRRRFPGSPKEDIRAFLEAFASGFCFPASRRLKFGPDDKVMGVYRTLYPSKNSADAMELECFCMNLNDLYGAEFPGCFEEGTTLGDVFDVLRAKRKFA